MLKAHLVPNRLLMRGYHSLPAVRIRNRVRIMRPYNNGCRSLLPSTGDSRNDPGHRHRPDRDRTHRRKAFGGTATAFCAESSPHARSKYCQRKKNAGRKLCRALRRQGSWRQGPGHRDQPRRRLARTRSHPRAQRKALPPTQRPCRRAGRRPRRGPSLTLPDPQPASWPWPWW